MTQSARICDREISGSSLTFMNFPTFRTFKTFRSANTIELRCNLMLAHVMQHVVLHASCFMQTKGPVAGSHAPYSGSQAPGCRCQGPNSRSQRPYSRSHAPVSRSQAQISRSQAPVFKSQAPAKSENGHTGVLKPLPPSHAKGLGAPLGWGGTPRCACTALCRARGLGRGGW